MTLTEYVGWESDSGIRSVVMQVLKDYASRSHNGIGLGNDDELLFSLLSRLTRLNGVLIIAREGELPVGIALYYDLPWDSRIFNVRMGKIETVAARDHYTSLSLVQRMIEICQSKGVRHLSIRTEISEYPIIHALEHSGFYLVDSLSLLYADSSCTFVPADQVGILREYDVCDLPVMCQIARHAFGVNRFTADPHLDQSLAREVYVKWVCDGVAGRADFVRVAVKGDKVCGFVLCRRTTEDMPNRKIAVGVLDLLAVDPRFQGHGVGKMLINAACQWLSSNSRVYLVGTRSDNYPALGAYMRAGFRLYSGKVGFHAWLED